MISIIRRGRLLLPYFFLSFFLSSIIVPMIGDRKFSWTGLRYPFGQGKAWCGVLQSGCGIPERLRPKECKFIVIVGKFKRLGQDNVTGNVHSECLLGLAQ